MRNNSFSRDNNWHFIDSGFQNGKYNMDYDMMLVEKCRKTGDSFLRVYRWNPNAISLGYNQAKSLHSLMLDAEKCRIDGIDIVTRPTGGRAVLHAQELTYSVVTKSDKPISEQYRNISLALLNGIKLTEPSNDKLINLSFTKDSPDLLKLLKTGMYNLCFNSQVKYEINYKGKKLVGSAQRKFGNIILQHGSVLIGEQHKNIVKYLIAPEEVKANLRRELEDKTVCLNELLEREVSYNEIANAIYKGFENVLDIKFSAINRISDFITDRTNPAFNYN